MLLIRTTMIASVLSLKEALPARGRDLQLFNPGERNVRITNTLAGLCAVFVAAVFSPSAHGQQYPSKPIKLIVGFGPGGATDVIARFYAQKWSEVLKTPVIVDNKPGAGQLIGIKAAITAPPDGYAVFFGSGSAFSQGPGVRKDLPYDPLKDFTLLGMVSTAPGVLAIAPSLPVRNVRELIAYSKENPSKLNYGSSGLGSASHLQAEYLMNLTGIKMTHIPYKSAADIMRELSVGSVHVGIAPLEGGMASISSGRVKALAVTGSRRLKALPDVASLGESGIKGLEGIDPYTYYGLAGPAGLSPAVVGKLSEALDRVSKMPDVSALVRERLFNEPVVSSPDSFRKFIETDLVKWKELGKFVKLSD
jgi:tripartite-type tricarboxylate transporter receptor subunit TctC